MTRLIDGDKLREAFSEWHLQRGLKDWMIGVVNTQPIIQRLTPEEERLIELGKAVEKWLANEQSRGQWAEGYLQRGLKTSTAGMSVTSPEELLEWYHKEAAE